jgi:hypothetical protein
MDSRRRVVAGLTIAAVALIVAGAVAVAIDSGSPGNGPTGASGLPGTRPSASATGTASPRATLPSPSNQSGTPAVTSPTPSAPPTPANRSAGFVARGSSIVYYTADGTPVPMEPIPGLRTALIEGRALYYALAKNPYNLVTGSYAGEFMPGVTMQQVDGSSAQTGGIALVGPVVNRLISDRLAQTSVPSERWVVALPVDIRNATRTVDVSFDLFGLHGFSDTPRVVVRFSGPLPVVNVIPANAGYHVLVEAVGVTTWQVIDPTRLKLSATTLDPDHMMNELLVYGTGTSNVHNDIRVDRRVPLGQVMLTASSEVSVSLAVRSSKADLGPDRILKIADVPVFVTAN